MERCICSEVATWKSIRGWTVSIHLSLSKHCYTDKFKELTSGSEGASARLWKNTFVVWCSPSHLVRTRRELWFLLSSKSIILITSWFLNLQGLNITISSKNNYLWVVQWKKVGFVVAISSSTLVPWGFPMRVFFRGRFSWRTFEISVAVPLCLIDAFGVPWFLFGKNCWLFTEVIRWVRVGQTQAFSLNRVGWVHPS